MLDVMLGQCNMSEHLLYPYCGCGARCDAGAMQQDGEHSVYVGTVVVLDVMLR